jgi:hypothetical protein
MSNVDAYGFPISSGGAEFMPRIQYDAKAGRWARIDRVNDGGAWHSDKVDITERFTAIFDFESIETGWIAYTGAGPNFALVQLGHALPAQPSDQHKRGVKFQLKLAPAIGGDKPVREMSSNAKAFMDGFRAAYAAYAQANADHPGQLPVFTASAKPVVTGSGATRTTNYMPDFRLVKWVDRPDDLPRKALATPPSASPALAPATGSSFTAPLKAALTTANRDDFG